MFKVFAIALLTISLSACTLIQQLPHEDPTVSASVTPESVVKLVEGTDSESVEVRAERTRADGFDDIYLEQGSASAEFLCTVRQTIAMGSASSLNRSVVPMDKCPELLIGVRTQIVNTETRIGYACFRCTAYLSGKWEYGEGVSVWRGIITIVPTAHDPSFVIFALD